MNLLLKQNLAIFLTFSFAITLVRYFLFSGLAYWLFYPIKKGKWADRKIQKRLPSRQEIIHEMKYSVITIAFFMAAAVYVYWTHGTSFNHLYFRIEDHGWLWFVLSVPVMLILHDAYFYAIHRFMHLKWTYRLTHQAHHRSLNPSPWAAYSFNPFEALLESAIVPLLLTFLPLHAAATLTFQMIVLVFNVVGHLGYELLPASIMKNPLGRRFVTSTYHNQHHRSFGTNYGLYFSFWDEIFGTKNPRYEEEFLALTSGKGE